MESKLSRIVSLALIIVAVIHLLPLSGVFGPDHLSTLYGLNFEENNIEILMRHRAILFGLLGVFLLYAALNSRLHVYGMVAGAVSVLSFLLIAWSVGDYNAKVSRVFLADVVALISLIIGAIFHLIKVKRSAEVE